MPMLITLPERLKRRWTAPVYAFFHPDPKIEYNNKGSRIHVFECSARPCKGRSRFVRRNLSTQDATSTKNLLSHAKICWGEDVLQSAKRVGNAHAARDILKTMKKNLKSGSIAAAFEREGKGNVTYSHRQFTKAESRSVYYEQRPIPLTLSQS